MNRRSFLFGGGIASVVGAAVALVAKESRAEGTVTLCKDEHVPNEKYLRQPAFSMSTSDERARAVVPCVRCGVLFALPMVPSFARVGVHVQGAIAPSADLARSTGSGVFGMFGRSVCDLNKA